MNNYRDSPAQQRRQELNPLTTQLSQIQLQSQTPASATTLSTPFGYHPATYTPASAVRSYNPMQWGANPQDGPVHSTRLSVSQDIEVPAPPPYSPPRSQRPAGSSPDEPSVVSPAANRIPSSSYRPSPEISSTTSFPPPPGNQSRASSRDRHHPSIFSLSAFRKSSGTSEAPRVSPELNRDHAGPSHTRSPSQGGISLAGPSHAGLARPRPTPIATIVPAVVPVTSPDEDIQPPASRRAASADAVPLSATRVRASSGARWEPGMPLPPPPPGPPPPGSRSQSMSRSTDRVISPPTRRPGQASTLGPVPPTPADWVDEENALRGRSPNRGLQIDTNVVNTPEHPNSGSSSSGLVRTGAVRGEFKSIRERRSESRTGKSVVPREEPSNNPWAEAITPSDIVVPFSALSRRPTLTKSTPRSGRTHHSVETPGSGKTPQQGTPLVTPSSHTSTPRPTPKPLEAPTPPFSPQPHKSTFVQGSPAIPPKSLPTPPPQSRLHASPRPVSHILHIPNSDTVRSPPLHPSRPASATQSISSQQSVADQFAKSAIERHNAFALREAAAATDEERVRMFAEFIVSESRIRRGRYASAIDALGSEVLELTRDLFRPYATPRRESTNSKMSDWQPESSGRESSQSMRSHNGSLAAALLEGSREPSEPRSAAPSPSPGPSRPETQWWSTYMPSLSPIPSMSVSEAPDESSSRGRPSSRWWEVSQSGSVGTPAHKLERHSKRESKYMGMPKELREALQWDSTDQSTSGRLSGSVTAGPSTQTTYSATDEYPPEKVGWHEPSTSESVRSTTKTPTPYSPAPFTPDPRHLDVSRLVTLPPPYPRHHPAVENNHPDLTSMRTTVRGLSDFSEVKAIKQRFIENDEQRREEAETAASKRKDSMRTSIRREIEAGKMSYADAAKIEAASAATEAETEKEIVKDSFERFQTDVVMPVNDTLMDRVTRATALFDQLRSKLFDDALDQSHNQTQEEGDEQPELLEKLTLLKWIFDAREQLHRELYDLLTDRNDRYRDMIILPYRLAGNEAKVTSAGAFFQEDAAKRKLAFEQESLKRTEEFGEIVENNVVRGVEVQLSAFWDIAPSLRSIIEKVPSDSAKLHGFKIQIPAAEYDENPGYWEHPMQYLYSLLTHAEKSSYQFIESQTNLLCLLHEVKGVVTAANCKLMETQRISQGERDDVVQEEMEEVQHGEERRLTDDLKEKVRCVDEQWLDGLGAEMRDVKARVADFLVATGGWEEDSA